MLLLVWALPLEMDGTPDTTPMPAPRQKNKEYQIYFELRGNDYGIAMSKVGQLMEDHFNHENESDSGDSKEASSDDDIDSSDTDSSDSNSDSNSDDEKKKRKKKSTHSKKEGQEE